MKQLSESLEEMPFGFDPWIRPIQEVDVGRVR